MPAVDLNKNKDAILKTHKEVSDPNSKTNCCDNDTAKLTGSTALYLPRAYVGVHARHFRHGQSSKHPSALFGYDGQTDVIKVVSKGDGGIEELIDELSSGKIMYAYIKVIDPNSNLPKFVFVNWQGEGVPEVRKGACANHVRDVQNLLRGAHVSINARNEDEVDEKVILSKVAKASGSNYSFHKEEKKAVAAPEPVGSVYQKVRPQIEIKPDVKQSFWEASEREEKQRILVEKQRAAQERAKLDKEIKDREEKETKTREQRENERVKKIREVQEAEKRANTNSSADKANYNPADAARDEEERAKRSDHMRKERAAEAKALVSGRSFEAKSKFEQKPTSQFDEQSEKSTAPVKKLKHGFLDGSDQPAQPAARKQPIQLPKDDSPTHVAPAPRSQPNAVAPPRAAAAVVQPKHVEEEQDTYDDAISAQKAVSSPSSGPQVKNLLAQGMPRRPPESDDEQEDEQNWDESTDDHHQPTSKHVAAPEPEEELYQDTATTYREPEEELYQDTATTQHDDQEELYEDGGVAGGDVTSGVCARALYDYQASEDNEITFDPEDVIADIEMIDEGWWIGTAPDGKRGMFPSNYVELF